jgi:hypothetical protein
MQILEQQVICNVFDVSAEVDGLRQQVPPLPDTRLGRRCHCVPAEPEYVCHMFPTPSAVPGTVNQHEGVTATADHAVEPDAIG